MKMHYLNMQRNKGYVFLRQIVFIQNVFALQMNKESSFYPFRYIFLSNYMSGFNLPSQIKTQQELLRF